MEASRIRTAQPLAPMSRSEEHTSELQSQSNVVCRLLPEKKRTERRNANLSRGSWPRAERGAADEARCNGPVVGVDRARGSESAVGHQPSRAVARGGRQRGAGGHKASKHVFLLRKRRRPRSTLFPYTTLFR